MLTSLFPLRTHITIFIFLAFHILRGEPGSALEELVRVYDGLQHPNAVKWAKGVCVRASVMMHLG